MKHLIEMTAGVALRWDGEFWAIAPAVEPNRNLDIEHYPDNGGCGCADDVPDDAEFAAIHACNTELIKAESESTIPTGMDLLHLLAETYGVRLA